MELLATWESGLAAGNLQRAVLLHALTRRRPAGSAEDLLATPVGRRDAELLALRRDLFGDRLQGRLACAGCGQELEFDVDVAGLAGAGPSAPRDPVVVEAGSWRVSLRPPTSRDLLAIGDAESVDAARAALLARCVVAADRDGQPVGADTLPAEVCHRLVAALADADPCADIRFAVRCVQCGRPAVSALDIGAYLWAELDGWARTTLLDVHLLATTYGWSEPEILAVSPTRRRYYLELAGHA